MLYHFWRERVAENARELKRVCSGVHWLGEEESEGDLADAHHDRVHFERSPFLLRKRKTESEFEQP